jgi:sugar lactone lactonase YvrE
MAYSRPALRPRRTRESAQGAGATFVLLDRWEFMRLTLSLALLAAAVASPMAQAASADPCTGWTTHVLASGLGSLENIEPDGRDGLFVSASTQNAVLRLTRDGKTTTAVANVKSPGGLRVRGATLYVNTGDSMASGVMGTADGTIDRLDLRTGKRTTWVRGLTMPNGLVLLPDGGALTSRDVAVMAPTGISRISPRGVLRSSWSDQPDSNGLAIDPTGKWLYSDETFTLQSNVYRTEVANPSNRTVVASLFEPGVPKGLDDLTMATSGILYVTANSGGQVIRLDPRTGKHCAIVSGLVTTSAVKQGRGKAFPASRLYVTGFDGRVLELVPPKGVTP